MSLTTDRADSCLHDVLPSGQNKCYLILSDEERAKGFVRPVRNAYIHKTCGVVTRMADRIAETWARNNHFYGATFCCQCGGHFPVGEFMWVGTDGRVTDEHLGD